MNLWYGFVRILICVITSILFRIQVVGRENIPTGHFVLVANHYKFWDPVIMVRVFRRELHFMAKKELFQIPLVGAFLRSMNAFPVDREANDLGAIRHSVSLTKEGKSLVIFPEGTRVKEKKRSNFKEGAALVASLVDVPILPVTIEGKYRFWGGLHVTIHQPIDIDTFSKDLDRKELRKEILDQAYLSIYGEEGFDR